MSHLTKLYLAEKKSGKRLFGRHQFMVTVGPLAVGTVIDKDGVFELLYQSQLYMMSDTRGTTTWEKPTRYSTGHQLPSQKWVIGQNKEQQK
jgi:hypothetical protein